MAYLTTPLYYATSEPHIGHAYTTLVVDSYRRFLRQEGEAVVALTGTDEHGEKIQIYADRAGQSPQAWVDTISQKYRTLWERLDLHYDIFYRTTDASHQEAVRFALQALFDRGEIVFREYEGNYCVGCERFITDAELTPEGFCPDHQRKPEQRKESNYFFLMSRYQEALKAHFTQHPEAIRPEGFRREVLAFLEQPLQDLCISRPKERLRWGIELPFDAGYVTYVWFDALLNYLVATGWPKNVGKIAHFEEALHFIGKDILKTHAVYWGAMLLALRPEGAQLFRGLAVNGYLLIGGSKMSKTVGNIVDPALLAEKYTSESLRYFFLREVPFGTDASFSESGLVTTVNAQLSNGIGNLASRVLTLVKKNLSSDQPMSTVLPQDVALLETCRKARADYREQFRALKFSHALKQFQDTVIAVDGYVNSEKPWALAKDATDTGKARLARVLGTCVEVLGELATWMVPFLPNAAEKLQAAVAQAHHAPSALEVPRLFPRFELPVESTE